MCEMGRDRCYVGTCDNNRRHPDKLIVSSNVTSFKWNILPKDNIERTRWVKLISKGRADFEPENGSIVCSVHFTDDKPTSSNSDPTLFLTM